MAVAVKADGQVGSKGVRVGWAVEARERVAGAEAEVLGAAGAAVADWVAAAVEEVGSGAEVTAAGVGGEQVGRAAAAAGHDTQERGEAEVMG